MYAGYGVNVSESSDRRCAKAYYGMKLQSIENFLTALSNDIGECLGSEWSKFGGLSWGRPA